MSAEQQQRFRVVRTQITNVQTQFLSELERQGLQIRESATNDIKTLQNSTTAQLNLLRDATSEVASQNDEIQDKLELMKEGDDRLRAALKSVLQSGNDIQLQLSRVERLVKAAAAPDGGVHGNQLAKAQDEVQKGYDLFARYMFERAEVTLVS
jgi:chromosome segregation ATPase